MSIRNLDKLFAPRRIAVIGASDAPAGAGSAVLRNLLAAGFRGDLYPVNPEGKPAAGAAGYPDLASVPEAPDLAVICIPAAAVPAAVRACGEAGVPAVIVLTPGFSESGPQGRTLERQVRDQQRRFDGLRILGPNSLGVIVPSRALNVSLATAMPPAGHVGFISQSAAMQTSVLDWAAERGVGLSAFVSAGNMLDISIADLIDYFGSATETRSIIVAAESIGRAREFMSAARGFARDKPIFVCKPGGADAVCEAAFERAGIEPVAQIDELYDCAELLARQHARKGGRAAVGPSEPAACRTPENTSRAAAHLDHDERNLELLHQTPRAIPLGLDPRRGQLRQGLDAVPAAGDKILSAELAKSLLSGYRIPVVEATTPVPAGAVELILRSRQDAVFGAVIGVEMGPSAAGGPPDRAWGLPPLDEVFARRMLQALRGWPALCRDTDRPAARVERLIETLLRISCLVVEHPEIEELELAPLWVTDAGCIAGGARVLLGQSPEGPHAHLAIAPYPEHYVTDCRMKDGTPLVLRPIKPEDEPLWHELLASCSTQTIWFRFSHLFKHTTHEMASRYCFIDYDRELGIVAEAVEQGARKLVGVGRLVADADHHTAEYALLVADRWQSRGLGGVLTDRCLEIAKDWGIRRVVGELSPDNLRMLAVFRTRGFEINSHPDRDVILVSKAIG